MTLTIDLPDRQAAVLQAKAAEQGVTPANFARHVLERVLGDENGSAVPHDVQGRAKAAVARIRELQEHVKPDPEGWTARDYINYGRE